MFYVLYPKANFITEDIDGFLVDQLEETVEFCRKKIYSYEPALEMLDEMYEYMEKKTNF